MSVADKLAENQERTLKYTFAIFNTHIANCKQYNDQKIHCNRCDQLSAMCVRMFNRYPDVEISVVHGSTGPSRYEVGIPDDLLAVKLIVEEFTYRKCKIGNLNAFLESDVEFYSQAETMAKYIKKLNRMQARLSKRARDLEDEQPCKKARK